MIVHLVRLDISGGTIKISNIETHMKLFKIMVVLLLSIHGLVHSLTTLVLGYLDPTNTPDRPSEVTLHVLWLAQDSLTAVDLMVWEILLRFVHVYRRQLILPTSLGHADRYFSFFDWPVHRAYFYLRHEGHKPPVSELQVWCFNVFQATFDRSVGNGLVRSTNRLWRKRNITQSPLVHYERRQRSCIFLLLSDFLRFSRLKVYFFSCLRNNSLYQYGWILVICIPVEKRRAIMLIETTVFFRLLWLLFCGRLRFVKQIRSHAPLRPFHSWGAGGHIPGASIRVLWSW